MTEQGTVIKIKNNLAYVEVRRTERCDGCRNCAFGANGTIVLPSLMQTSCAAGDTVLLQMPQSSFAGVSLLLFLVPLLLMLLGFLAGMLLGAAVMLLFGFSMLGIGIGMGVFIDRSMRKNPKFSPVIVERIE